MSDSEDHKTYQFGEPYLYESEVSNADYYTGDKITPKYIAKIASQVWSKGMSAHEATQTALDLINESFQASFECKNLIRQKNAPPPSERDILSQTGYLKPWGSDRETIITFTSYLALVIKRSRSPDRLKIYRDWIKENPEQVQSLFYDSSENNEASNHTLSTLFADHGGQTREEYIKSLPEEERAIARIEIDKFDSEMADNKETKQQWAKFSSLDPSQQDDLISQKFENMRTCHVDLDCYDKEAMSIATWLKDQDDKQNAQRASNAAKTKAKATKKASKKK